MEIGRAVLIVMMESLLYTTANCSSSNDSDWWLFELVPLESESTGIPTALRLLMAEQLIHLPAHLKLAH